MTVPLLLRADATAPCKHASAGAAAAAALLLLALILQRCMPHTSHAVVACSRQAPAHADNACPRCSCCQQVRTVEYSYGEVTVDAPRRRRLYLPGSFNPLHTGALAAGSTGCAAARLLSLLLYILAARLLPLLLC